MSAVPPQLQHLAFRIGNYSGVLAISLHVYGVGGDHIATGVNRLCPTA